jgi:hypothetical protein
VPPFPSSSLAAHPGTVVTIKVSCAAKRWFSLAFDSVTVPWTVGSYPFYTTVNDVPVSQQAVETVVPGPATALVVTGAPTMVAGATYPFMLTALDAFGNVATSFADAVAFGSGDPAATLPGPYAFTTADAGSHSFTAVLRTAGPQDIKVDNTTDGSPTGATEVVVMPGAATHLTVTGLPPSTVAGAPLNATVSALDAYNNLVTGYAGTVGFSSTDPRATLPDAYPFTVADAGTRTFANAVVLLTPGTQSITVSDPVLPNAVSGVVDVTPAALDHLALRPGSADVTSGGTQAYVAEGFDAFGNDLGDVTASTALSIAPDGTCSDASHSCSATLADVGGGHHTVTGVVGTASGTAQLRVTLATPWACTPDRFTQAVWTTHLEGPLSTPTQVAALPSWVVIGDGPILRTLGACNGQIAGSVGLDGLVAGAPTVVQLESGAIAAFVATSRGSVYRVDIEPATGALGVAWVRDLRRMLNGVPICQAGDGDGFAAAPVVQLRADASQAFRDRFAHDVLYVGTADGCGDTTRNRVLALDAASGGDLWVFNIDGTIKVDRVATSPVLDAGADVLYVPTDLAPNASGQSSLFALDVLAADGAGLQWDTNAGALLGSPALGGDRLYVANKAGILLAYPKAGDGLGNNSAIWSLAATSPGAVVIADLVVDGPHVFVADTGGVINRVDDGGLTGHRQWSQSLSFWFARAATTPLLYGAGTPTAKLFVGADDGGAWQLRESDGTVDARRSIDPDGASVSNDGPLVTDVDPTGASHPAVIFGSSSGNLRKVAVPWPFDPPF